MKSSMMRILCGFATTALLAVGPAAITDAYAAPNAGRPMDHDGSSDDGGRHRDRDRDRERDSSDDSDTDSDDGDNATYRDSDSDDDPGHNDPPTNASSCKSDGSPKRADQRDCPDNSKKDRAKDSSRDRKDSSDSPSDDDDPCKDGGRGSFTHRLGCAVRDRYTAPEEPPAGQRRVVDPRHPSGSGPVAAGAFPVLPNSADE
ncbi:MAG TPA: hypothetical protein VG795_16645 [Acidimicrobiia bacterium]|nr:hypothetical protein [Acidimicrobiia bacterium]